MLSDLIFPDNSSNVSCLGDDGGANMKYLQNILLACFIAPIIGCAFINGSDNNLEKPGVIEKAPPGKYGNESGTVWEEPDFFDNDNGTAAEVPI